MAQQTILMIRHAEKPDSGNGSGVDVDGGTDKRSLTPTGWQRAGMWAELFAPSLGVVPALPRPSFIFASLPVSKDEALDHEGSRSRRPLETVRPLAAKLNLAVDLRFGLGDETELGRTLSATPGIVLVCWQHESIAAIVAALLPAPNLSKRKWPDDRFNVVFRFDRPDTNSEWTFQQIVPLMLAGDSANEI